MSHSTAPAWVPPTDAQLRAAERIADLIIAALTTERGVHAETAIASAARLGGTFLFRSLGLPTGSVKPGTPVLSDAANVQGPLLVQTFGTGLARLGVTVDQSAISKPIPADNTPHLSVLETQAALEAPVITIADSHRLDRQAAAHACALAACHPYPEVAVGAGPGHWSCPRGVWACRRVEDDARAASRCFGGAEAMVQSVVSSLYRRATGFILRCPLHHVGK
jgi:hypothetical protein